ncbi:MAG: Abi family protein [bacterium]|nr:Abi family protein [bacterium]
MRKQKISIDEQIEKMRSVGIKFDNISENEAKDFICNNTYYFKIKAFQKNYEKNSKGKYVNLDFSYLKDFSTIDMQFRNLVLSMALNIEHSMKVKLNRDISENEKEDGYSIVNKFLNNKGNQYIVKNLYTKVCSNYAGDLIKKYCSYKYDLNSELTYTFECPFWVLIEILSFGDFINFYNFYYAQYELENPIKDILFPIKYLRNASAHNNCVLNSLKRSNHTGFSANKKVNSYVSKIKNISKNSRNKCMSIPVLHDFAALLMVYVKVVNSESVLKHTADDLQSFLDRFNRNKEYYALNNVINMAYIFLEKVIDNYNKIVYNNDSVQKP